MAHGNWNRTPKLMLFSSFFCIPASLMLASVGLDPKPGGSRTTTTCGDELVEGGETCDDGDTQGGDGCDASCQEEPGWRCEHIDFSLQAVDIQPDTLGPHSAPQFSLSTDRLVLTQPVNSFAYVYSTNIPDNISSIQFTIEVSVADDDDFVGWVVGYDPEELLSADADWLLFDWKQASQNYAGYIALQGLSVSRVSGVPEAFIDLWEHSGPVTELARANTLGSTGWADKRSYAVEIRYAVDHLEVWVDGVQEFNLTGTFPIGSFGMFGFSQGGQRYQLLSPLTSASVCAALDSDGDGIYDPEQIIPVTPTPSPTPSPTLAPTPTPTAVPTPTPTPVPTPTPTPVPTPTPTPVSTATPTAVPTPTPTAVPTPTPTAVPSLTPTFAETDSPTLAATASPTPAPTATVSSPSPVLPSESPTPPPDATPISTTTSPTPASTQGEFTPHPTEEPSQEPTATLPTQAPTETLEPTPTPEPEFTHSPTEFGTQPTILAATAAPDLSPSPVPETPSLEAAGGGGCNQSGEGHSSYFCITLLAMGTLFSRSQQKGRHSRHVTR